jgi:hypothetical protein
MLARLRRGVADLLAEETAEWFVQRAAEDGHPAPHRTIQVMDPLTGRVFSRVYVVRDESRATPYSAAGTDAGQFPSGGRVRRSSAPIIISQDREPTRLDRYRACLADLRPGWRQLWSEVGVPPLMAFAILMPSGSRHAALARHAA